MKTISTLILLSAVFRFTWY